MLSSKEHRASDFGWFTVKWYMSMSTMEMTLMIGGMCAMKEQYLVKEEDTD